jgi:hypothetical protein
MLIADCVLMQEDDVEMDATETARALEEQKVSGTGKAPHGLVPLFFCLSCHCNVYLVNAGRSVA